MNASARKRREPAAGQPVRDSVRSCLERYLEDLDGHDPSGLYQMVIAEVEPAILQTVMDHAGCNLTRAAEMLGINRSTLRKKLRQYEIEY